MSQNLGIYINIILMMKKSFKYFLIYNNQGLKKWGF